MISKHLSGLRSKGKKAGAQMITGRKFAEGMGAAALVGLVAGVIVAQKTGKKTPEEWNKSANTVTIEVNNLEKLKIERIE